MRFKIPLIKHARQTFRTLVIFVWLVSTSWMVNTQASPGTDQALFWSIGKDGQTVGHLLGTIHSEDPRVLDFSDDLLVRLKNSQVYAMEMVPDLPTLARLTEYMRLPEGQNLEVVIGSGRFASLTGALSSYGVPPDFINRMKPWAAMMTLSTPPPITGFYMDLSLSLRASGSGLQVVGLETLEQQLSFLENMPMDMQLSLLDQAIDEFDHVGEAHDQMVDAYLENNLAELQSLSDEHLQEAGQEAKEYFMQTGIHDRNRRMIESILPHLADKTVFVAVGALHLHGEDGLLALLRQRGYELKPLAFPFKKPQG